MNSIIPLLNRMDNHVESDQGKRYLKIIKNSSHHLSHLIEDALDMSRIENDKFEIKALSVGGELLGNDKIDVLASLPTRDQALSMLANVMLAPVTKLTRTLNEVPSQVVRVVDQVAKQKAA